MYFNIFQLDVRRLKHDFCLFLKIYLYRYSCINYVFTTYCATMIRPNTELSGYVDIDMPKSREVPNIPNLD